MTKHLVLGCGCDLQDYGMGLAISQCNLHQYAPELLEACKALLTCTALREGGCFQCENKARAIIARVERAE